MLAARGLALVLLSRELGGAQFGVYALLLTTYNVVLSLAAFGLEQANLYLAGRRPRRVPALLGNSLLLAACLGLTGSGLFLLAVSILRYRIFTDAPRDTVMLCAIAIPIGVLHNSVSGIVVGLGRFRHYGLVEAAKWAGYLAAISLFYVTNNLGIASGLGCFFAVTGAAGLANLIVLCCSAHGRPRLNFRMLRRTLSLGRNMLLVQLSHILSLRLDVYAVRAFGSNALVGHYALASHISEIVLYVARSFSLVVFSGAARGDRFSRPRLRGLARWIVLAAVVLCTVLLVARKELLHHLFGNTSEGLLGILAVRLPGVLAASITLLFCSELLGRGRSDLVVRGQLMGVLILASLAWLFTAVHPTLGAAGAFTLSALLQVVWIGSRLRAERRGEIGKQQRRLGDWNTMLTE